MRRFKTNSTHLVHHGINCVFQVQHFTLDLNCNFLRQVATCHGLGDLGNVPDLVREVGCHGVYVVGEFFPDTIGTSDSRLSAKAAFGSNVMCHTRHFGCKQIKLVNYFGSQLVPQR